MKCWRGIFRDWNLSKFLRDMDFGSLILNFIARPVHEKLKIIFCDRGIFIITFPLHYFIHCRRYIFDLRMMLQKSGIYFSLLLVHLLKNIPCKLKKWIIKIINFIIENIYVQRYIYSTLINFIYFFYRNNEWKQVINNVRQKSNNSKLHHQKSQSTFNHRITPQIHQNQQNPNFRLNQLQPFPNQILSLVLIKRPECDIKIPDTYPHRSPKST